MDVRIGFAEFDALAVPFGVNVGWAEFDVLAAPVVESAPPPPPPPPPTYGGLSGPGFRRTGTYTSRAGGRRYTVEVADHEADDEEVAVMLLLNLAARELL